MQKDVKCPKCDSNWFQEVTFHRYEASAYGSAELMTNEGVPREVRVGMCGYPLKSTSGRRGGRIGQEYRDFLDSVSKVHMHLDRLDQFVTKEEMASLRNDIEKLKSDLKDLRRAPEHAASSERPTPVEAAGKSGKAKGGIAKPEIPSETG